MEEKREYLYKGRILEKQFSRTYRLLIFLILFLLSIIIKIAEITISLQKYGDRILEHFDKPNLIYFKTGIILGNLLFINISLIENRKKVTFICFFVIGILYFIYSLIYFLTETKWAFDVVIFFISILKDYKDIFIPVWIDQFCIKKFKTVFMYIYLTDMIGYPLELLIISIIQSNKWYENAITFGILGGLIIFFDFLLLYFPNMYFSSKYNFIGYKDEGKDKFIKFENSGQTSFFESQEDNNINNNEIGGFLKTILNNKIYIFSIIIDICYLFFVLAFVVSLSNSNYDNCFELLDHLYISSSLFTTDHTFNILKCGFIIFVGIGLLCFGGYENKKSSIFFSIYVIIIFFCLLLVQLPSPNLTLYLFLLISTLIAFIFPLPLLTINKCFIVNCIPNKYKGSGVALSLFLRNIIQILKPFLKFFFNLKDLNRVIFLYILIMIFCFFSSYYRYRNYKNENENEINNGKEKELEDVKKV